MSRVLDKGFMRPNAPVKAMGSINGLLYVGGYFSQIGGVARNNLACINTVTKTLESWNPLSSVSAPIQAIVCLNGIIYVACQSPMTTPSGTRQYVAAFDQMGNLLPWDPHPNASVLTLDTDGVNIYLGGNFTTLSAGAIARNHIARVSAAGVVDPTFDPNTDDAVNSVIFRNGVVYAGGTFLNVNGSTARSYAAAFEPTHGGALSWDPHLSSQVLCLESDGTRVYVGGDFEEINNGAVNRAFMAATDPTTGADLGIAYQGTDSFAGPVLCMKIQNGQLAVGGFFKSFLGSVRVSYANITMPATLNPETADFESGVLCTQQVGADMFLGGFFTHFVPVGNLSQGLGAVRTAAAGGLAVPFPNVSFKYSGGVGDPTSVVLFNGVLYIGGLFDTVTGNNGTFARNNMAALDLLGNVLPFAPVIAPSNSQISSIVNDGGNLYIGGSFTTVNGVSHKGVACLDTTGVLNPAFTLDLAIGAGAGQASRLMLNNGSLYVAGTFSSATSGATVTRNSLLKADAGTGVIDGGWDPAITSTILTVVDILDLTTDGVHLYAVGLFDAANSGATHPNGIISLPLTGTATDNQWPVNLLPAASGGTIGESVLYLNGQIYVGGQFSSIQGSNGTFATGGFAKADLTGKLDTAFIWQSPGVTRIVGLLDQLYASSNGTSWINNTQNLTLFTFQGIDIPSDGINTGFNANPDSSVLDIVSDGSILYFVGQFSFVGLEGHLDSPQGAWYLAPLFVQPDPPISVPRAPQIDFLIRKEG